MNLDNWNNIENKIPKINTVVYILGANFKWFFPAQLKIYDKSNSNMVFTEGKPLKTDDIYWGRYSMLLKCQKWSRIENFPYWMEGEDLLKMIVPEVEELNRFEIMDIQESE